ncbi:MAG: sulfurtransferase TusA family protein [Cyanobacteria bacterium P01_D01_bin.156]
MTDTLHSPDATLDLRGTPCPLNFVRTKLKLQQMLAGELLEVWLDAGEPVEQVPDSLRSSGFLIENLEAVTEGYFVMHVRQPAE